MLIDVPTLARHLADPSWIVFDCRHDLFDHAKGPKLYQESHLPGAIFASMDKELAGAKNGRNGRHPLPRPEDFGAFLNLHGITPATQIVAYDDVGGQYAARLWWLARWIGLTRVAVLDGGLPKWVADGHPVTSTLPSPRPAGSIVAQPDAAQFVDSAGLAASLGTDRWLVVDARAPERFRGETEPIDPVAGHIPGAQNRFFKANLQPDLTMRPAAELRREFEALLGSRRPEQVAHQCGSGVTACVNLLAMEHAGLAGSKLHAGSWSEWIADPARPVARGA
jgi:thiosulfate/3-mercaptopyruvate sulfurtransferase